MNLRNSVVNSLNWVPLRPKDYDDEAIAKNAAGELTDYQRKRLKSNRYAYPVISTVWLLFILGLTLGGVLASAPVFAIPLYAATALLLWFSAYAWGRLTADAESPDIQRYEGNISLRLTSTSSGNSASLQVGGRYFAIAPNMLLNFNNGDYVIAYVSRRAGVLLSIEKVAVDPMLAKAKGKAKPEARLTDDGEIEFIEGDLEQDTPLQAADR